MFKKTRSDIRRYQQNITLCAIKDILKDNIIYFEKTFVYMKFYPPIKECDTDNQNYKPIIDEIRYSMIVKNDTYERILYMVDSEYDKENPRTKIIIGDQNELKSYGLKDLERLLEF